MQDKIVFAPEKLQFFGKIQNMEIDVIPDGRVKTRYNSLA